LIDANAEIVAESGEPFAILKRNELESACARPRNLWAYEDEDDVLTLAASLLAGIAQNHPFAQGNKRTALIGARNFLQANGYDLDIEDEVLGPAILDLVAGHIAEEDLAEILDEHLIDI